MQDHHLHTLQKSTHPQWTFTITNQTLTIQSTQPMWIDFYNIAGIPFNDPGLEKFTPEYLQKYGKKTHATWQLRLEPKWSTAQKEIAKQQNQKIYQAIKELPDKHGIAHLKSSHRWHEELFWGANEAEKKRAELYKIEKENLLKTLAELPTYESEKYSLFNLDKNWFLGEKASHLQPMIYPKSEEKKIYELVNKFEDLKIIYTPSSNSTQK